MTVGRRPKPPALRELGGNAGKRPIPKGIELEAHSGRCPSELDGDATARLVWERAVRPLCKLGVVKRAHEAAAVLACQSVSDALEVEQRRRERGKIARELLRELRVLGDQVSDELVQSIAALARMLAKSEPPSKVRAEARQWLSELGLTPTSSAKLIAPTAEDNPLARFLAESA